jgi:aryl carrier-like protein
MLKIQMPKITVDLRPLIEFSAEELAQVKNLVDNGYDRKVAIRMVQYGFQLDLDRPLQKAST